MPDLPQLHFMEPRTSDQDRLPSVTVVTHSPSPYQVELFDAVAKLGRLNLSVVYLYAKDGQRLWQAPSPFHERVMLTQAGVAQRDVLEQTDAADLVVINYYKHPFAKAVMLRRGERRLTMCFWGERPQRAPVPWLSKLARQWRLRSIIRSSAPVWGIGAMAVNAYKREFGGGRTYVNLPYFSDLRRFREAPRHREDGGRVFLFSGALSHRKGVDVLAAAFAQLARQHPAVRLRVMGAGDLEALMRERLRECSARVEFTGFRDWSDLHLEYARADVLCVPSRHDGWGLVVPEGLAAGLPVIGTQQTGAAAEFIKTSVNGWLIPHLDEELLCGVMREAACLSDIQLAKMSLLARESVAGHGLEDGAGRFADAACAAIAESNQRQRADAHPAPS